MQIAGAVLSDSHRLRAMAMASSRCTSSTTTSCIPTPELGRRPSRRRSRPARCTRRRGCALPPVRSGLQATIALLVGFFGVLGRLPAFLHQQGRPLRRRLHRPPRDSGGAPAASASGPVTFWRSRGERPALVALHAGAPRRRRGSRHARPSCSRSRSRYVITHALATRARRRPRRPLRERLVQDERRPAAEGLVHPLQERRGGDLVPRPRVLADAGEDARAARLRRPALRPPRRGRERGRPEPPRLAGREDIHAAVAFLQRQPDVDPGGSAASASRSAAR